MTECSFCDGDTCARARYFVLTEALDTGEHRWNKTTVGVHERTGKLETRYVCGYVRNYPRDAEATFEPFTQDGHDYALVSRDYMNIEVLDLETGEFIGREAYLDDPELSDREVYARHFCPVDILVPCPIVLRGGHRGEDGKWVLDGTETSYGGDGTWGLVAGCVWGDDFGWKLQYLDLSELPMVRRDDRFGVVEIEVPLTDHVDIDRIGAGILDVTEVKHARFTRETGERR